MEAGRPLFIRLSLPPGLEEALEGLAREILRSKTDNILLFAAEYFENLVQLRGSKGNISFGLCNSPLVITPGSRKEIY
jgi:hypothetical protein